MTTETQNLQGTLRERINAAERSSDGVAQWQKIEGSPTIKLWSTVEQAWTGNLPANRLDVNGSVYQLDQIIQKCSECTYTGYADTVGQHVTQSAELYELHKTAEVETAQTENGFAYKCTACGTTSARRHAIGLHIEGIRKIAESHRNGVKELTIKPFTLGPSEPYILNEQTVSEGDGSEVNRVVGETPQRPRRRRRRRNRSRR